MKGLLHLLLPRTDGGVLVQLVVTLIVGFPLIGWLRPRAHPEVVWFAAGVLVLLVGFFAFRAAH